MVAEKDEMVLKWTILMKYVLLFAGHCLVHHISNFSEKKLQDV